MYSNLRLLIITIVLVLVSHGAAAASYPYPLQDFRVESQQQTLTMRYLDVEPQSGTQDRGTALLLHGKNFCADYWVDTIELLRGQGYRVVVPEQIGFCSSDLPHRYQYSFHQLANNTRALLDALGIDRTIVVAHSMGGMLGTRYALKYPAAVQRLVLVNPIGLEDWIKLGVPHTPVDEAYAAERKKDFESIKQYQLRSYYDGQWSPAYERWARRLASLYEGERGEAVAWSQALTYDMLQTQPVVHEFADLAVPTLLIIGQRDRTAPGRNKAPEAVARSLGDYPQLGRKAAKAIPNAELVEFDGLGHLPQIEDFDRYAEALTDYLR